MDRTSSSRRGGYRYWVSDEELRAFGRLSVLDRLIWLDEARRFTILTETGETRERRERLRRGETIV